jgi:hypothetical protein
VVVRFGAWQYPDRRCSLDQDTALAVVDQHYFDDV